MNKQAQGELMTYLVITARSIPEDLRDANGDPIQAGMMQLLHDLAAELELGREVHWDAEGSPAVEDTPADVVMVPIPIASFMQLADAAIEMKAALGGDHPGEVPQ